MESTFRPPLAVKGEVVVAQDPGVRAGSGDLWEVFLELPCVPCDVGWLWLLAEPTSAPRGSMEVFFFRSQDGGPSHMGEQPELAGFLGQPAV